MKTKLEQLKEKTKTFALDIKNGTQENRKKAYLCGSIITVIIITVLTFTVLCSAKTKSSNEFYAATVVSEEEYGMIAVLLDNPSEVHFIKVDDVPFEVNVGDRVKVEKFTHFVFNKEKGELYKCTELLEKTKLDTETD